MHVLLRVIGVPLLLVLAACGGAPVMTSYDGEKSRIRGALPADIPCKEQGSAEVALTLTCLNGPLDVTLYGQKGPPVIVDLTIRYDEMIGQSRGAFMVLANAYGLAGTDIDRCDADGGLTKQFHTYVVECRAFSGFDFLIAVRQQTVV